MVGQPEGHPHPDLPEFGTETSGQGTGELGQLDREPHGVPALAVGPSSPIWAWKQRSDYELAASVLAPATLAPRSANPALGRGLFLPLSGPLPFWPRPSTIAPPTVGGAWPP